MSGSAGLSNGGLSTRLRDRLVQPLQRWLVLSHLTVFLLPVLALVCSGALATDLQNQTREDLSHQAALVALHIGSELRYAGGDASIEAVAPQVTLLLIEAKAATLAGFRVVDTAGIVVAASGEGVGEDISTAEEVQAALAGEPGLMVRPRDNSNSRQMPISGLSRRAPVRIYQAVPIRLDGQIYGAVVLSRTPREEIQTFWQMAPRLSVGVAVALGLTVGLGVMSGLVLSRSLKRLAQASRRIAAGQHAALVEIEPATRSFVSEARELAVAMATMSARLQERLRYITEFAGNVSHEFKTPVSSLRGTVELLRDDDEMPPEQRSRFLSNALFDLDRLSRLVGGLLRLARAEEGGERRVVPLQEVVSAVVARHPTVRSGGVAGAVEGNREQLETVLQNLVENALRHGGDGVNIRVLGWREGVCTGFSVEDDGPGISAANVPRVFDRFFTTARDQGGTGLGLALVKAICQAHGGVVEVESKARRTVFRARFPQAAA